MKNPFKLFRSRPTIEKDVDEELDFHLEMQTGNYESEGIAREASRTMAETRFGNVARIRQECVRISARKTVLVWFLDALFMMSLTMGLLLRVFGPEMHVNRVGDVMMMIGGLGILLVYAKQAGARVFNSNSTTPLGLKQNSTPVAFDEQGRTPFDRVRSDD